MSKNQVLDWDPSAGNNSEIAGINISEGCPASGINDAIRTMMSQLVMWITSNTGPLLKSGGTVSGAISGIPTGSTVQDSNGVNRYLGYRSLPMANKASAYQIALTDVGQGVAITTGGITVPANTTAPFSIGDTIVLYNNSASNQTITASSSVVLRLVGSTTVGTRTLAGYGICTLLKIGTDEWVAMGGGLS